MVTRDELISFIENTIGLDLLAKANQIDENANGVQIHGAKQVTKIALGVSTSLDFFREVVKSGAQFTLTHHGLHLSSKYLYNSRLDQSQQAILKYVFTHDLTVSGYHYSLDVHPEVGNNSTIIKLLGAKKLDITYFDGWGWVGEFSKPLAAQEIADKLAAITSHDVFAVYGGPDNIKRIGVCSGGAKPARETLHEIYDKNIELHIAGEIGESGVNIAKDAGFNYFSAGHYATEVFGVQELGKKIKEHFKSKLEVEFIDIPNIL
jgi:dinuclear metal center YbgI/SA1388 family protein